MPVLRSTLALPIIRLIARELTDLWPGASFDHSAEPYPHHEDPEVAEVGAIARLPYDDSKGRALAAQADLQVCEDPPEEGRPPRLRAFLRGTPLLSPRLRGSEEEDLRAFARGVALEVAAWAGRQASPERATDPELELASGRCGSEALASRILGGRAFSSRFAAAQEWARRHAPADHPVLRRERAQARLDDCSTARGHLLIERARAIARLGLLADDPPEEGGPGLAAAEAALALADDLAALLGARATGRLTPAA